jgi:two-component sensor histidine kinase
VQAIVNLSRADTMQGLKEAIEGRIQSLANVQSLFVESRWVGAELSAIAARELEPYGAADKTRVRIEGPSTLLEPTAAQAVAVTLHELATNAAKYGSLSAPEGKLDLTWRRGAGGELILRWEEAAGPKVENPGRQGFGSRIIKQMIGQLQGDVQFDWRPHGLVCEMIVRA